jgi:hypothetical protein
MGANDGSVRSTKFTSACLAKKQHNKTSIGPISAIRFAKKRKSVLVGHGDSQVLVLNTSRGKKTLTHTGPRSALRGLRVQAKSNWAVVDYANGKLRFLELKKGYPWLELEHVEAKLGTVGLALGDKDQTLLSACGQTVSNWNREGLLEQRF